MVGGEPGDDGVLFLVGRLVTSSLALAAVIVTLPGNLTRYMQGRMDIVELASPFLRLVMRFGTLAARSEEIHGISLDGCG